MLTGFSVLAEKENIAVGGTVIDMMTFDTPLSADYAADKILDGNTDSMMYLKQYGAEKQWVKIDLNGYYNVSEIEFVSHVNGDGGAISQMADIYVSAENVPIDEMTHIGGAPENFAAGGASYSVMPEKDNVTKYVAIRMQNTNTIFKCAELKVYAESKGFNLTYDKEQEAFKVSGTTEESANVSLVVTDKAKISTWLGNIVYVDGMNAVNGGYKFTVPSAKLEKSSYDFTVNENGTNTIQSTITQKFGEMVLESFNVKNKDGNIKAEAVIGNYSKSENDRPAILLAVYSSNNKLENIVCSADAKIVAGDLVYYSVTAENVPSENTVKAFIWNSAESAIPFGNAAN